MTAFDQQARINELGMKVWTLQQEILRLKYRSLYLRQALQWALDEGGWRLPYYSSGPVPNIIEWEGTKQPRIKWEITDEQPTTLETKEL